MLTVTLVVVTHNSVAWLDGLARTWQATVAHAHATVPIVLADSGSTDDTLPVAAKVLPSATVLPLGRDVGFGTAANAGAKAATTPWLLLCNPDLQFAPEFFSQILAAAQRSDPATACLAPQLLNPDGSIQPSIGRFPTLTGILRDQFRPRQNRKYLFSQPLREQAVDWATGACLLVRRQAFDAVGGFDEKYFLYGDEVDLQRRFHNAGLTVRFVPAARVTHVHPYAARPPRRQVQRWATRGTLRYFAKFGSPATLSGYRLLAFLSRRLPAREVLAGRAHILSRGTKGT